MTIVRFLCILLKARELVWDEFTKLSLGGEKKGAVMPKGKNNKGRQENEAEQEATRRRAQKEAIRGARRHLERQPASPLPLAARGITEGCSSVGAARYSSLF